MKLRLLLGKVMQDIFMALFAWSCLIIVTLGFMLTTILIIAGKAQIPITLIAGTGSTATSTDSLTRLTQGNDFVCLQIAMWVFVFGCGACLISLVRNVVMKIIQRRRKSND